MIWGLSQSSAWLTCNSLPIRCPRMAHDCCRRPPHLAQSRTRCIWSRVVTPFRVWLSRPLHIVFGMLQSSGCFQDLRTYRIKSIFAGHVTMWTANSDMETISSSQWAAKIGQGVVEPNPRGHSKHQIAICWTDDSGLQAKGQYSLHSFEYRIRNQ